MAEVRQRAEERDGGGDFCRTQNVRLGRRFAVAVINAAQESRLPYREAYALTGLWGQTFDAYAAELTGQAPLTATPEVTAGTIYILASNIFIEAKQR